ncbi:OmpA family protein [Olleya marilimosa]|uniref:OmpA family protein n=1 Tax=Olleya marilimosa TaxID=272164 RepID=UPI0004857741|nr:OmpA family protein [Olleya marilimosa]
MKQFYNILSLTLILVFSMQFSFAQNTEKTWSFETGFAAIDVYPVGEDFPQGEYLDEFLNLNDHWNYGVYVGIARNFNNNLSLSARGTFSEISKWGDLGAADESVLVDNLKYYGLDAMINYAFGKGKLQPFLAVGGGYTWIEEGPYNTSYAANGSDLVGAGTANGALGLRYNVSNRFGINLQTTYKHSFEDYLTKHWAHSLGLVYNLGQDTIKEENSTDMSVTTSKKDNRWSFETGVSAIDVYPVGENAPQGDYFDEFFNLNDHWNLGVYVGVTKNFNKNLSITARGTLNELTKWGDLGSADESVLVDNLKYYGLDGMINYAFGKNDLQPFLAVGGGYTWIEEGPYNTSYAANGSDLVGAGTVNGAVGLKYSINDDFGLNLQTTYKHAFKDYLPKHFAHSLGIVYKLGNGTEKEEVNNDTDGDGVPNEYDVCPEVAGVASLGGCPDTDGDGVADKDDLCPEVKGSVEFGGCPDTDGDGFPDNKDNCPDVKGTDNGCPLVVKEVEPVVNPIEGERKVYFAYDSAELDLNAKIILDQLTSNMTKDATYNVSIVGHADNKGGVNYNYNLSVKRAQAIKAYLVSKGLASDTITTTGVGETQPASSNTTAAGRAENRRGVLTIKIN